MEGNKEAYSVAYKIIRQRIAPETVLYSISSNQVVTKNWNETAGFLLDSLIPDCPQCDQVDIVALCHSLRESISPPAEPWTGTEVFSAIKRLPRKKAPGADLIEAEMLKAMSHSIPFIDSLRNLFNNCLEIGVFPSAWKLGLIRILLKAKDKDATDPKSYRPICVLPLLGKLLERLIRLRLRSTLEHGDFRSPKQFGFREGCSTEDAIYEARRVVAESSERYVLGLLYDATQAFDHLCWPALIEEPRKRGCPKNLLILISSHLSGQTMQISGNYNQVSKRVTKGCLQRSILGPDFWNAHFDGLLLTMDGLGCGIEVVAYADDLLVMVQAPSRQRIEQVGQMATDVVTGWFASNKLTLSQKKTEMIMLKGSLQTRAPIIRINDMPIKLVESVRYRGVTFGSRLNISRHLELAGTKWKVLFNLLAISAGAVWGIRFRALSTMYKGIFLAIMCYAVGAWGDLLEKRHVKNLLSNQRHVLLRVTKAYRMISTAALLVLAGAMPLELVLRERMLWYMIRKNKQVEYGQFTFLPGTSKKEAKKRLREALLSEWPQRWESSGKGRVMFHYLPSVRARLGKTTLQPGHYLMQALSFHGNFKADLDRYGLVECGPCRCGEPETSEHVLFECEDMIEAQSELTLKLQAAGVSWPPNRQRLLDRDIYPIFEDHVRAALNRPAPGNARGTQ